MLSVCLPSCLITPVCLPACFMLSVCLFARLFNVVCLSAFLSYNSRLFARLFNVVCLSAFLSYNSRLFARLFNSDCLSVCLPAYLLLTVSHYCLYCSYYVCEDCLNCSNYVCATVVIMTLIIVNMTTQSYSSSPTTSEMSDPSLSSPSSPTSPLERKKSLKHAQAVAAYPVPSSLSVPFRDITRDKAHCVVKWINDAQDSLDRTSRRYSAANIIFN
jgi:hypothetical protein